MIACHNYSFQAIHLKMGGGVFVRPYSNSASFGPFRTHYGWCDFFIFYSPTRAQTKRGGQHKCKMAHNTRIRENTYLLGSLLPLKTPKIWYRNRVSMQMKILNISKTVTDSAIVCLDSKYEPLRCEFKQSLHLTCVDLETYISRSSVLENNDKWRVVVKRSEISAHIVWGASRNSYAASSNRSLHLACVDLETPIVSLRKQDIHFRKQR